MSTLRYPQSLHCDTCQVAWVSTDPACWSCGRRGMLGLIPMLKPRHTPGMHPCERCDETGLVPFSLEDARLVQCPLCYGRGRTKRAA